MRTHTDCTAMNPKIKALYNVKMRYFALHSAKYDFENIDLLTAVCYALPISSVKRMKNADEKKFDIIYY